MKSTQNENKMTLTLYTKCQELPVFRAAIKHLNGDTGLVRGGLRVHTTLGTFKEALQPR